MQHTRDASFDLNFAYPCAYSQQVAEVFTGSPGKYVDLKDTISGFKVGAT